MRYRNVSAALLLCGILLTACRQEQRQTGTQGYEAMTLGKQTIEVSSKYTASVQGRQDIAIYPQVSGTITRVGVKEGQRVTKGQSLFVIDQVPFEAALQMAEANVEAAEAGVATTQLLYDSRQKLFDQGVISEFDLLTSKNDLKTAKARLAQAEAERVTARNNMTYTRVESPADGVVGTIPFREGALVSPQSPRPLTTVSDNSLMYVYFSLSENELLSLMADHGSMQEVLASLPPVELELSNGQRFAKKGRIETISGVVDPATGSVSARAVFPNQGDLLRSGLSGKVVLTRERKDCIVIPCEATYEMQDLVFVFRYVDGKAESRQVKVSLTDDAAHYIVTEGLEAGDVIVTEGVGMLRDGAEINVNVTE